MKERRQRVDINKSSVIKLRAYINRIRQDEERLQTKIWRLERTVYAIRKDAKVKIAKLRKDKNIRYDKLRWKLHKKSQQVWVLQNVISTRHRIPRKRIQEKAYKSGMANANRTAKEKWYNKGLEKGKIAGIRIGRKEGKQTKMFDIFYKGVAVGKDRKKKELDRQYNFRRRLVYKVESAARMSIIMNRLSRALKLPLNLIAFLLWCSEHEYWTKRDIDRAFDDIGFDGYYTCTSKCKKLGLIEDIMEDDTKKTWRLTLKGTTLTGKMNTYIGLNFKKK